MTRLILVMGLPGSGKTTLSKKLTEKWSLQILNLILKRQKNNYKLYFFEVV